MPRSCAPKPTWPRQPNGWWGVSGNSATAMAVVTAARTEIETRLAETEAAHRDAQQRAAADLHAAAEQHTALEDRLRHEINARTTLEEQLAAAATARENAEHQQRRRWRR